MAKRKSNRAARRLLARHKCPDSFRISNRRWMVFGSNYPFIWEFAKPSRSQRHAAKVIRALRAEAQEPETEKCVGCNKRGEPNQKDGGFYCYGSDRCCP